MTEGIGWLGAGKMGEAMVERLLDAGHSVAVWNRTPGKVAALVERGAAEVSSPALAATNEVVFSMVLDDTALAALYERPDGVLDGTARVWVDCSSVSPSAAFAASEAAAARGIQFISAPVSGNPAVVRAGNLIFAASGDAAAIESVRPLLEAIGRAVHVVGSAEQATVVKICTNAILGVVMEVLSEAIVLGEANGVTRAALLEFVNDSAIGSNFSRYKTPALVANDFAPTFTSDAMLKDFRMALALAEATESSMPIVDATESQFARLVESGVGTGLDISSTLLLLTQDSGAAGPAA